MTKINRVLFIDDNEADNFYHRIILEELDLIDHLETISSPVTALDFLTTKQNDEYPSPNIIFLDINMPRMNGWEFLEEFQKLPSEITQAVKVYMLSTTKNPDDEVRAEKNPIIEGFVIKPLTEQNFIDISQNYFDSLKYVLKD